MGPHWDSHGTTCEFCWCPEVPAGRENNGAVVHGNKMYLFLGFSWGIVGCTPIPTYPYDRMSRWKLVNDREKGGGTLGMGAP